MANSKWKFKTFKTEAEVCLIPTVMVQKVSDQLYSKTKRIVLMWLKWGVGLEKKEPIVLKCKAMFVAPAGTDVWSKLKTELEN